MSCLPNHLFAENSRALLEANGPDRAQQSTQDKALQTALMQRLSLPSLLLNPPSTSSTRSLPQSLDAACCRFEEIGQSARLKVGAAGRIGAVPVSLGTSDQRTNYLGQAALHKGLQGEAPNEDPAEERHPDHRWILGGMTSATVFRQGSVARRRTCCATSV